MMKQFHTTFLLTGALVCTLLSAPAMAKQSPITITSEVNELIEVKDAEGKPQLKVIAPDEIVPGDRILFTTRFSNKGAQASDNVMITNAIPAHTRYRDGSATGEHCDISFSVDGGRVWGTTETLKVRQKDGQYRAATAADFTHIRWTYKKALQPAEMKQVTFETTLL